MPPALMVAPLPTSMVRLPASAPATTRSPSSHHRLGTQVQSSEFTPSAASEISSTGRLPNRSLRPPAIGAHRNCMNANTEKITPTQIEASA